MLKVEIEITLFLENRTIVETTDFLSYEANIVTGENMIQIKELLTKSQQESKKTERVELFFTIITLLVAFESLIVSIIAIFI